ncbi:MAG: hypothetical protein LPK92_01335, partial [Actinomycetes bacterium]|nr:hypothetical protein [Actinomycetes bacterium]
MRDLTHGDAAAHDERTALGLACLSPEHAADLLSMLTPDDYGRAEHAAIHALYADMTARGIPVDIMTVPREAHRHGWDRFGGSEYVCSIADHVPSVARSMAPLAEAIRDHAARRRLLRIAEMASQAARGESVRSVADPSRTIDPVTAHDAIDATLSELAQIPVGQRDEWSHGFDDWDAENAAADR